MLETYADSDALLTHIGNADVGELVDKLVALGGGLELDVFGTPSPQLTEAIAGVNPRYYSYFMGR